MAARSPLRLLAPIALAVVLVGVVLVVTASDGGSGDKSSSPRTATAPAKAIPRRRTYVVKEGDTLTSISDKTGVSTGVLLALNPGLDPQSLQLGKRLKLRP